MKLLNPIRLSVGLAALFVAQSGWALGTAANTQVTNSATIEYAVGGVDQTAITSAEANFLVDRKVDLNVTGNSATPIKVTPSSTGSNGAPIVNQLIYTLTNEGNDTQDFQIDLSHLSSSGNENFNADDCKFFINNAQETAIGSSAIVDNLAADATATITVVCNMQDRPTVSHGDESSLDVLATALLESGAALTDDTTSTDLAGTVQNVFADDTGTSTDGADSNAKHSATQTYLVEVPMLSITKASAVISDPINDITNPKRIPGAIIEYTIVITNGTSAADASQAADVTIKDVIDEITKGQVSFVANSIVVTGESTSDSTNYPLTTTAHVEPTAAANELTVTGLDIAPGTSATVKFQVEIDSMTNTSAITY